MPRDAERRARSRAADAARKKARRALSRIEKEIAAAKNTMLKKALFARKSDLQEAISKSYATRDSNKKFQYTKVAEHAIQQLQESKYMTKAETQKFDMRQELQRAAQGKKSALGEQGLTKAKLFYRATQSLWEGFPLAEREQRILEGTNSTSLVQAYSKIMRLPEVQEALQDSMAEYSELIDTESYEGQLFLEAEQEASDENAGGSPIVVNLISAYTAQRKQW